MKNTNKANKATATENATVTATENANGNTNEGKAKTQKTFDASSVALICQFSGLSAIGESLLPALYRIQQKSKDNNTLKLIGWLSSDILPLAPASKAITAEDEAGKAILAAAAALDRPAVSPWAGVDRVLSRLYLQAYAYTSAYNALMALRFAQDEGRQATAKRFAGKADEVVKAYTQAIEDELPWSSEGYEWNSDLTMPAPWRYWQALSYSPKEGEALEACENRVMQERKTWQERLAAIRDKNAKTTAAFARKIGGIVDVLRAAGYNATDSRAMASWCFGGGKDKVKTEVNASGEGKLISSVQDLAAAYALRDKTTKKRG